MRIHTLRSTKKDEKVCTPIISHLASPSTSSQVMVRGAWMFTLADVQSFKLEVDDTDDADLVQGQHQLVLSTLEGIIWGDAIDDLVEVVQIMPMTARVQTMLPGQMWMRTDIVINPVPSWPTKRFAVETVVSLLILPSPPFALIWLSKETVEFCHGGCIHQGKWRPERDEMRYCEQCWCWYHLDCLDNAGTVADYRAKPYNTQIPLWLSWAPMSQSPDENEKRWELLTAMPIQRGFMDDFPHIPLTSERIVTNIREMVYRGDMPDDVESWVEQELRDSTMAIDQEQFTFAYDIFDYLTSIPLTQCKVYKCPASHML